MLPAILRLALPLPRVLDRADEQLDRGPALERARRDRREHQVESKASLRRFVPPDPPPRRPGGRPFTEADLDAFFASLDASLFPAALAAEPVARAIGQRFLAARRSALALVHERLDAEAIDATLDPAALDRAITRALLAVDRRHLADFVGAVGVTPLELAIALWTSHAHGLWGLAHRERVWPWIAAALAPGAGADALERARPERRRASPLPSVGCAPRAGLRLYEAMQSSRL